MIFGGLKQGTEHDPSLTVSNYYATYQLHYAYRKPIAVIRYDQILLTFSTVTWSLIGFSLLFMSIMFKFFHYVYHQQLGFVNPAANIDFLILTISSLTEPDPLPWFSRSTKTKSGKQN